MKLSTNPFLLFDRARQSYQNKQFGRARELISAYRSRVQYDGIEKSDQRDQAQVSVSLIIVSFCAGQGLLECLDSLKKQASRDFEVILVDNGGNDDIHARLAAYSLLHLFPPVNLLPSEGRNLGAHFSRGTYLAFIDDDAIIHPGYVESILNAWRCYDFIAIRGRILPRKGSGVNTVAGHYDMGAFPIPSVLMTEGNMAIQRVLFRDVGGFDPLVFGGEGTELSWRCWRQFPGRDIYYWPAMVIYHDFARGGALAAKKQRHRLAAAYFDTLSPDINQLQQRYGRWYNQRPDPSRRCDQRNRRQKLWAWFRERQIAVENYIKNQ